VSERLTDDIKVIIAETEKLLKATAGQTGDKIQAVRDRVSETLESAKTGLADVEKVVTDSVKSTTKAPDELFRKKPLACDRRGGRSGTDRRFNSQSKKITSDAP
jgi:ElaB/YqjD/DUF883 family membrane-anchored ribosome-binding protein